MSSMSYRPAWRLPLLALVLLLSCGTLVAAGTGYLLPRWTLAPGGEPIAGGSYALRADIGQPATGLSSGGEYTLRGGWALAGIPEQSGLFLPLVVKG